jgi:CelD/BcsL family acetyltransferase involved in cellulose biosynthesis
MRRYVRQLNAAGGGIRLITDPGEVTQALKEFARLHHLRWRARGGSAVLTDRVEQVLADAARQLIGQGRFQLWMVSLGDDVIGSGVFLSAGTETAYWLGGFDERKARFEPSLLTILAAVRYALANGGGRFNLGAGGQPYKYRFSDDEETLEWSLLLPPGLRGALARSQMLPQRARTALAGRLPPRLKKLIRQSVARVLRDR